MEDIEAEREVRQRIQIAGGQPIDQRSFQLQRPYLVRCHDPPIPEFQAAVLLHADDDGALAGGGDADRSARAEVNRK